MTRLVEASGKPLLSEEAPTPKPKLMRVFGNAMFLAFRSAHHAGMSMANLRFAFEPPLVLEQFRIFRFDEVPRAIFTWEFFRRWGTAPGERRSAAARGLECERRADVDDRPDRALSRADVEHLALGDCAGQRQQGRVPVRRVEEGRRTRRIVEVRFDRPGRTLRLLSEDGFA